MKKTKLNILAVLALTASSVAVAQQPINSYFLEALPQAYNMNPGQMPEGAGYLGFPLLGQINLAAGNTGFAFKDIATSGMVKDSLGAMVEGTIIHLDESLLENMKANNYLNLGFSKDFLGFGFKVKKKNYLSFNITSKFLMDVTYSKDLFSFLLQGNGADEFKGGNPISLDGTGYNVTAYNEYGIGYARQVNDKLNIGGRIKILQGFVNASGNFDGIKVTTADDLSSMTIQSSLSVKSSGLGFISDSTQAPGLSKGNTGLALDLGASYKINKKITAFASVADLGKIKWNESSKTSYNDGATFEFTGLDAANLGDSLYMSNLTDSVVDIFKLKKDSGSYSTTLPTRLYLGGKYQFTKVVSADVLYSAKFVNGKVFHSGVLGVGIKGKKWFEGRLSYGVINGAWNQVGLATVFNLGALQVYFVTDNIAGLMAVDYTKSLSASVGANFTIGRMESKADKAKKAKEDAKNKKEAKEDIKTIEPVAPVEVAPADGVAPAEVVPTDGTAPAEGTQEGVPTEVAPVEGTTPTEAAPVEAPAETTPAGDIQGAPVVE